MVSANADGDVPTVRGSNVNLIFDVALSLLGVISF
jgi:hypothetical protein